MKPKFTRKSDLVLLESTHTYYLDGTEILSNTQCLEKAGIQDYSRIPAEIRERSSAFGRVVHKVTELWDRCILDDSSVDPMIRPYLEAWKRYCDKHVKSWLLIEQKVFCPVRGLWVAGTIDRVYTGESGIVLVDIKSAYGGEESYKIQTAGYTTMFEWLMRQKVVSRQTVELREDGDFTPFEHTDAHDFQIFDDAVEIAYWKSRRKRS